MEALQVSTTRLSQLSVDRELERPADVLEDPLWSVKSGLRVTAPVGRRASRRGGDRPSPAYPASR